MEAIQELEQQIKLIKVKWKTEDRIKARPPPPKKKQDQ